MLIQISAGKKPPKECEYACYLLLQELRKEFPTIKIVLTNYSSKECLRSAVLFIEEDLSYLVGTVQWICKSPFRPNHGRKNWFVDISILKERIEYSNPSDIKYEAIHSSGKGGQHVNKSSTAIRATHIPTGISAVSMDERSQLQNKKMAYYRLVEKLNDMESNQNKRIEYDNWNNHNQLIRGNAIRVYQGKGFKRIK